MRRSCALLGGFAVGFRCDNIAENVKCQRVLVPGVCFVFMYSPLASKDAMLHGVM